MNTSSTTTTRKLPAANKSQNYRQHNHTYNNVSRPTTTTTASTKTTSISSLRSPHIISSPNLNFGRYFSRNRRRSGLFRFKPDDDDDDDDDDEGDNDDNCDENHVTNYDDNYDDNNYHPKQSSMDQDDNRSDNNNNNNNDKLEQKQKQMSRRSGHGVDDDTTIAKTTMKKKQKKKKKYKKKMSSMYSIDQLMYIDEQNYLGWYSPWFFINWCIFLVVPAAYVYIGLVVLRELCRQFPGAIYQRLLYYTPHLAHIIQGMKHVSWFVEIWCYIEALFYIGLKLQIKYLNSYDPLETSLAAAPLMTNKQRDILWNSMISFEKNKVIPFITGWFFDTSIYNISKYDIRDFISWSMFEGRHLEHLTLSELNQLESFVKDLEELITIELHHPNTDNNPNHGNSIPKNNDTVNNHMTPKKTNEIMETKSLFDDDQQNDKESTNGHNGTLEMNEICQDTYQIEHSIMQTADHENDDDTSKVESKTPIKNSIITTIQNDRDSSCHHSGDDCIFSQIVGGDDNVRHNLFPVDSRDTQTSELPFDNDIVIDNGVINDNDDIDSTDAQHLHVEQDPVSSTWRGMLNEIPEHQMFRFREVIQHEEPSFFSDFLESYRHAFMSVRHLHPSMEELRNMVTNATSVQELRNIVNQAANEMGDLMNTSVSSVQEIRNMAYEISSSRVQEIRNFMIGTAGATASHMYEKFIPSGSVMDKRLTAVSHATYGQLIDAWNSVKNIRERLEMAINVSKQRKQLRQQLKGYRVMLNQMRENSFAVPSKQMAQMMNRITDCNERMELLESKARAAFLSATGFTLKNIPGFGTKGYEPQRFAKYSSDPLLGLATYPLGFHLAILGCTEIPLRIIMKKRGFERTSIGPITYYYHPGIDSNKKKYYDDCGESTQSDIDDDILSTGSSSKGSHLDHDMDDDRSLPLVFIHGIGLGLLMYMPLINALLKLGRPLFLPEIPFVSGFRPWQSPHCVLQPAVVTSTMTAMLATHGYLRACWIGHSYGTAWLSYMCQLANSTVASIMFLDPICFGLHIPFLAKQFVYARPDPGTIAYIVRTDVIVKWTIQRSFPWAWIELFLEQIGSNCPCHICLSENDALVPAKLVKQYLNDHGVPIESYCTKQNKRIVVSNNDNNEKEKKEDNNEYKEMVKEEDDKEHASENCNEDNNKDDVISDDDLTVRHNNDTQNGIRKTPTTGSDSNQYSSHSNIRCTVFLGDGHGDWTERSYAVFDTIGNVVYDLCLQVEENDRQLRQQATTTVVSDNHKNTMGTIVSNIPSNLR